MFVNIYESVYTIVCNIMYKIAMFAATGWDGCFENPFDSLAFQLNWAEVTTEYEWMFNAVTVLVLFWFVSIIFCTIVDVVEAFVGTDTEVATEA